MAATSSNTLLSAVAVMFLLLGAAVSQASGGRVLRRTGRPEGASAGEDKIVESSHSLPMGCMGSDNKLTSRSFLLLGFLPKGTVVTPSRPSKRSNGFGN
ncbi:hypothetical protein SAY87_000550 [Trapa incisa]|uniref:Uncharacterized protein n=1 Tax=Trapa incisa TaxID=236973 RepID=A0AAN7GIZ9_9MYRT|nr:hypothetical protein SAY87_000550 [Trapa incisa]